MVITQQSQAEEEDDEEDGDDDDDEGWNGFEDNNKMDVDMDEAPALVDAGASQKKQQPEIDEDGFTKVVSRKKR